MTLPSIGTHNTAEKKLKVGEGMFLLDLPEQLLSSAVLSRISSPRDFANARLVCRRFASLVPLSLRFLDMKESHLTSTRSLCAALSNMPNLEALCITNKGWGYMLEEDANMVAVAAAQHCTNLVSFRMCMRRQRPLRPKMLQQLLRLCPHLGEVTVGDHEYMHSGDPITPLLSFLPGESILSLSGGTLSLPQHFTMEVDKEMVQFLGRADKQRVAHLNLWATRFDEDSVATGILEIAAECHMATFIKIPYMSFWENLQQPNDQSNEPLLYKKLGRLGELRELRSLFITGTGLFAHSVYPLPQSFHNLRQLVELSIENVKDVGDIDVACHLLSLTTLIVVNTSIPCIPEHISLLTNLEILSFCTFDKLIVSVPESLRHLSLLRELQLSLPMTTSLPDSLAQLQRVTKLDLSGSYSLCALPDSLLQMTALKELDIRGCYSISEDDVVLCQMKDLVQLHEG